MKRNTSKRAHLHFLINGVGLDVVADPIRDLKTAARKALKKSGNVSRPVEEWQIRDVNGVLLESNRVLSDFGFKVGARLFLSLAVGAGGCYSIPCSA